jgi:hypothetical protein
VLQAFGRFVLERRGLLARQGPEARERLTELTRTITDSPSLLAREREIFERYTASLAALIAEEVGAGAEDVTPWVVANALMGIHRALIDHARRRIVAGTPSPRLNREVPTQGRRALAALEGGLESYGVR